MNYYPNPSIPAYLIRLIPEIRIDGQVVKTGEVLQMGSIQNFNISFSGPVRAWNGSINNKITAGEYYEIGLNLSGSISRNYSSWVQELQRIKTDISNNNIAALNREDIMGQSLEGLIKAYFHQYNLINFIKSKQSGIVKTVLPSMGMAIEGMKVEYMWSVPFTASLGGISMDVDRLFSITIAQDGDKQKAISFSLETGIWSSVLEHMIPELFYLGADSNFESISAIKALQIASDLSIPIFRLDKDNYESLKSQLSLSSDTRSEIENAIYAGKVVITPSGGFSYKNWAGIGYVVLNQNTGAGAYMIGGMGGSEQVNSSSDIDAASDFASFLRLALHCNLEGIGMSKGVLTKSKVFGVIITFVGTIMEIFDAVFQGDYTINRARAVGMSFSNGLLDLLMSRLLTQLMAQFVACVLVWQGCVFSSLFWVSFAFSALFLVKQLLNLCFLEGKCFGANNIIKRRGLYYA